MLFIAVFSGAPRRGLTSSDLLELAHVRCGNGRTDKLHFRHGGHILITLVVLKSELKKKIPEKMYLEENSDVIDFLEFDKSNFNRLRQFFEGQVKVLR